MIDKVRVHEIAKELGIKSKEVVDKATEMGLDVKTASSGVSPDEAEKIMNYIMNPAAAAPKPKPVVKKAPIKDEPATDVSESEERVEPKNETAPAKEEAAEVKAEKEAAAIAKEDEQNAAKAAAIAARAAPAVEEVAEEAPATEEVVAEEAPAAEEVKAEEAPAAEAAPEATA